jgi:hypothetical protein
MQSDKSRTICVNKRGVFNDKYKKLKKSRDIYKLRYLSSQDGIFT